MLRSPQKLAAMIEQDEAEITTWIKRSFPLCPEEATKAAGDGKKEKKGAKDAKDDKDKEVELPRRKSAKTKPKEDPPDSGFETQSEN